MLAADVIYHDDQLPLHGYVSYDANHSTRRPAVMVVHDWSGRNAFACEKVDVLAEMGYVGFAVDMFGYGHLGHTTEEKSALIEPFFKDRALLLKRMNLALATLKQQPMVDLTRIAVIGFCFGGLCTLDLARSGAEFSGAVSFHGLLNRPEHQDIKPIKAKILALHGYEDPMVPPDVAHTFCQEMTIATADWQMTMYGHTKHAFMNPDAHDDVLGTIYNASVEKKAWRAMTDFLSTVFAHE